MGRDYIYDSSIGRQAAKVTIWAGTAITQTPSADTCSAAHIFLIINDRSLTVQSFFPIHLEGLFQAVGRQGKTMQGHQQQGYGLCHDQSQSAS
jgi:hypothetical protein